MTLPDMHLNDKIVTLLLTLARADANPDEARRTKKQGTPRNAHKFSGTPAACPKFMLRRSMTSVAKVESERNIKAAPGPKLPCQKRITAVWRLIRIAGGAEMAQIRIKSPVNFIRNCIRPLWRMNGKRPNCRMLQWHA
jgi:hypothetical protein